MKKALIIITAVVFVIAAILFGVYKKIEKNLESLKTVEVPVVDLSGIEDGIWSGSYTAIPVSVDVEVTVEDNVITDIKIIRHDNGQGAPAESITGKVLESQSLQVDVVSGATYSSKVILLAIKNALLHGKK